MSKEKNIKVIIVEPQKPARVKIIKNDLFTLQQIVRGHIECIKEDGYDIIINEEGKLFELEPNFNIFGGRDYVAGTAIFSGVDYEEGEFKSLDERQIKLIKYYFKNRDEVNV